MNPDLERRYRRLLRLLPAGYRQGWEEDMVSAFLHSTVGRRIDRPPLGERLSVIALAVRLRLAGQHASPQAQVWYRALDTFALLALLTWALYATVGIAAMIGTSLWATVVYPQAIIGLLAVWGTVVTGPLWIAAFVCHALGRLTVARALVLVVAGLTVAVPRRLDQARTRLIGGRWRRPVTCRRHRDGAGRHRTCGQSATGQSTQDIRPAGSVTGLPA
ncbi:MAG: hypothetical protein IRY85_17080 [Micromonosporaceae bacterium]|nr:hypothetical protein [Micromonosporaceae bacterium]